MDGLWAGGIIKESIVWFGASVIKSELFVNELDIVPRFSRKYFQVIGTGR